MKRNYTRLRAALAATFSMAAAMPALALSNSWACPGGSVSPLGIFPGRECWTSQNFGPTTDYYIEGVGTGLLSLNVVNTSWTGKDFILGVMAPLAVFEPTAQLNGFYATITATGSVYIGVDFNANALVTLTRSTLNVQDRVVVGSTSGGKGVLSLQNLSVVQGRVDVVNGRISMVNSQLQGPLTLGLDQATPTTVAQGFIGFGTRTRGLITVNAGGSLFHGSAAPGDFSQAAGGIDVRNAGRVEFTGLSYVGGATIRPGGVVLLSPAATVETRGSTFLTQANSSLTMQPGSLLKGPVTLQGATTMQGAAIRRAAELPGGPFTNSGTLSIRAASAASVIDAAGLSNTASGRIEWAPGARLNTSGGTLSNAGTIVLQGNAEPVSAALTHSGLTNGGTVRGSGNVYSSTGGTFTQLATGGVFANGGDLIIQSRFDGSAGGTIGAQNGRLIFFGDALFKAGQVITQSGTGRLIGFNGKVEIGNATERGSLGVMNAEFLDLQSKSNLFLDFGGVDDHDYLYTAGLLLVMGGKLTLSTAGSFEAGPGSIFSIFRATRGITGTLFSSIDTTAFALAPGARLDMSNLYTTGTLAVVAVPEPATWLSLGAGLLLIGARARRWRQEA